MTPLVFPPYALGAPRKFKSFRPYQDQAFWDALEAFQQKKVRFVIQSLPTGAGKSLIYCLLSRVLGRTAVLTCTKALEHQLLVDFERALDMRDIRGQSNYDCLLLRPGGTYFDARRPAYEQRVDYGPCLAGYACDLKRDGCLYFDAYREALAAPLVVTNYAYWMAIHAWGEGLGEFDLLVCDEAHRAPEELASFFHTEIGREEESAVGLLFPVGNDLEAWQEWAARSLAAVRELAEKEAAARVKPPRPGAVGRRRYWKDLSRRLARISQTEGPWLVNRGSRTIAFDPVWPRAYGEQALFRRIPSVLLTSATVREKTADLVGVPPGPPDGRTFLEYPSTFPAGRHPIVHVETVRMSYKNTVPELDLWARRIDQIIASRLDRKGIVHTVSYQRRRQLLERSRHGRLFLSHEPADTERVVSEFRRARAPCVLLSPSLATGYDFAGRECEYIVIAKVPFPDSRDPVLAARNRDDPDYAAYLAMQELVQSAGRGMRSAEDQCEVLIVDDQIQWFLWRYRRFAPQWFLARYRSSKVIPPPPQALPDSA